MFCSEHLKRSLPTSFLKRRMFQVTVNSKDKVYDGEIIAFGNTASDDIPASVKIFNLTRQEVVTVYLNATKMQSDLQAYEFFKDKLPLVPMLSRELDRSMIKEKLILSKPIAKMNENEYLHLFETIVRFYVRYFKSEQAGGTITVDDLLNEAIDKGIDQYNLSKILSRLHNFQNKDVILKVLHGDFTYSNLLLYEDCCYFIDFEHFGQYCFYYDIFWLMQNEYVYGQNKTLLTLYFNGQLDSIFEELFDSVGDCFDNSLRDIYYSVFLLEMFNKRIYNLKEREDVFNYLERIFCEFHIGV